MTEEIPSKKGAYMLFWFSLIKLAIICTLSYSWNPSVDLESHNNLIQAVRDYKEREYIRQQSAILSKVQIQAEIRATFPQSQWQNAYYIVGCESSYNQKAHGDRHLMHWNNGDYVGDSIGLFQIRTGGRDFNRARANGMTPDEFRAWMFDPRENIKYAYTIWQRYGFSPWSCSNTK